MNGEYSSLEPPQLAHFLERRRSGWAIDAEIDLDSFLREVLSKARQFVPSESGSILLDDPLTKTDDRASNDLVFVAAFGDSSDEIVGRRISSAVGIAGRVYQTGRPYRGSHLDADPYFYAEFDQQTDHQTRSILAVPIHVERSICGVLELVNHEKEEVFSKKDEELLDIFAEYTSISVRHVLDARRAQEIAKRDDLTGLYNDRFFHLQLTVELVRAKRTNTDLALIFFDLDNFKSVNDTWGHLAGSQVLREVGYLIKKVVTWPEAILARYGGDEFVAILPNANLDQGAEIAEEIRVAIRECVFLPREYGFTEPALNLQGVITCSLGVAPRRRDVIEDFGIDQQKNDILRRADTAMYEAKGTGRDRVVASE